MGGILSLYGYGIEIRGRDCSSATGYKPRLVIIEYGRGRYVNTCTISCGRNPEDRLPKLVFFVSLGGLLKIASIMRKVDHCVRAYLQCFKIQIKVVSNQRRFGLDHA